MEAFELSYEAFKKNARPTLFLLSMLRNIRGSFSVPVSRFMYSVV